ncbi:MAG: hypothetical protein Q7S36_02270 [Candidatus Liptonbacteria bacterium]|nr:hypothetical protein [Candidatus Liptonbacteria bacterium]
MKKLLFALPFLLLVTVTNTAFSAGSACDLSREYATFQEATKYTSYSAEDIQRELRSRMVLLNATIDCATKDIDSLKADISEAGNDEAIESVRGRVLDALGEATRFYSLRKASIKDQGIQGTKDLAKEVRNWRDNNYQNLADRVKNFLVWSDNQFLFEKASERLSQSQFVVTSLKLLENQDSEKLYYDAKSKLENAENLNQRAGDALAKGLVSDETLGIIKSSLVALSDTYKSFLEISGELTKVLPTGENEEGQ